MGARYPAGGFKPVTTAPKFLALAAIVALIPALGACESTSGEKSVEPVKITSNLDNAPAASVPQFPIPEDRDLRVMTSKLSGGSVEIYELDGTPPPMGASVPPVQPVYDGIPLATDPRVTVYPLDGAPMAGSGYGGGAAPSWPSAAVPPGGQGMTPPPGAWGGDAPMDIVSGRLSPRQSGGVSSVYFNYGSANIGSPERSVLRNVAETAKFAPVDRVSVEGHASAPAQVSDPIKAKILNLKESMNRAQAVSQNLIESGVPAEKIKAVGWGDTKQSPGNEADQRRVDVITGLQ